MDTINGDFCEQNMVLDTQRRVLFSHVNGQWKQKIDVGVAFPQLSWHTWSSFMSVQFRNTGIRPLWTL